MLEERIIAWDREETEPCQKLTPGCSIDHEAEREADPTIRESECETW